MPAKNSKVETVSSSKAQEPVQNLFEASAPILTPGAAQRPSFANPGTPWPSAATVTSHAAIIQRLQATSSSQTSALVRQLQQSYGNRYVQRVVVQLRADAGDAPRSENRTDRPEPSKMGNETPSVTGMAHTSAQPGLLLQAKLTIGAPNDPYEREADRVAIQVVQQLQSPPSSGIQPQAAPKAEKLQLKSLLQLKGSKGSMAAPPAMESSIQQLRGHGQPLAESIRQPMEQAFGADFNGVRVHTHAQADQLNRSIQAKAFTTGQDLFFRQGEYNPDSREGQQLLAHELTHVEQQNSPQLHQVRLLTTAPILEHISSQSLVVQAKNDKPKRSNVVTAKEKDAIEKAARQNDTAQFIQLAQALYTKDANYYINLLVYKLKKHQNTPANRDIWLNNSPAGARNSPLVAQYLPSVVQQPVVQQPRLPPPLPSRLPQGWTAHTHPQSGKPYYYNAEAKTTQWDRPVPGQSQGEYDKVMQQNLNDRDKLKRVLEAGKQQGDRRLKNSIAWIESDKAKLFAVSHTADSSARATSQGKPGKTAYFPNPETSPKEDVFSDIPSTYDWGDLGSSRNVDIDDSAHGWQRKNNIVIVNASQKAQNLIEETLRHETQHAADRHEDELQNLVTAIKKAPKNMPDQQKTAFEADWAFIRYKTEYRAFSYEGSRIGTQDPEIEQVLPKLQKINSNWTREQVAILLTVFKNYSYVKEAFEADATMTNKKKFIDEVAKYNKPDNEGFNKYNSPAVDDFYNALNSITVTDSKLIDENHKQVRELLDRIQQLSQEDAQYIWQEGKALKNKITNHLDGVAKTAVIEAIKQRAKG